MKKIRNRMIRLPEIYRERFTAFIPPPISCSKHFSNKSYRRQMFLICHLLVASPASLASFFLGVKGFFYGIKLVVGTGVFYWGRVVSIVTMAYGKTQFAFDIGDPAGFNGIAVFVFDIGDNLFVCWHNITLLVISIFQMKLYHNQTY